MKRYFFDFREDGNLIPDDAGVDLPDLNSAKTEAIRALAGCASEVVLGPKSRELAIEVRDDGSPLFRTSIVFEVENLNGPK